MAAVLRALTPHLEPERQPEAPVRAAHRYLSGRRDQLDYAGARAAGLPIGSGEIESGHRHVIQQRLKRAGSWWHEPNAEAMLGLAWPAPTNNGTATGTLPPTPSTDRHFWSQSQPEIKLKTCLRGSAP